MCGKSAQDNKKQKRSVNEKQVDTGKLSAKVIYTIIGNGIFTNEYLSTIYLLMIE